MLERRCAWRGIGFGVTAAGLGDAVDPDAHDLFYLGGGQDRDQRLCAFDLVSTKREALHAAAARGAIVLGVCGGFQLLGHRYELGADEVPGLASSTSRRSARRTARGSSATSRSRCASMRAGRRGCWPASRTTAGALHLAAGEQPLGGCSRATATTGSSGFEGVRRGSVIGTYLHGPLLRRTPGSPTGSSAPPPAWTSSSRLTTRSRTPPTRRRPRGADPVPIGSSRRAAATRVLLRGVPPGHHASRPGDARQRPTRPTEARRRAARCAAGSSRYGQHRGARHPPPTDAEKDVGERRCQPCTSMFFRRLRPLTWSPSPVTLTR